MNTTIHLQRIKRPTRARPKRIVWVLRWYDTHGRRCCDTIGEAGKMTKREADHVLRERQGKIDCGMSKPNRLTPITLGEFFERDMESNAANVKHSTLLEYGHAQKHALVVLGKEMRLDRIDRAAVGRIKRYLRDDLGRADATVRKTIKSLSASMNRAIEYGLLTENPFKGQARGKTQSKRKRIFQPAEIIAMLEVAPTQWWRVFIKLLATTGLRKSEALNLHWSDIDFDARTVTVSRKDAGTFEATGETFPVLAWSSKTCEERTVPLPQDTANALQRFILAAGGSRYVFLSLDRLRTIRGRGEKRTWRQTSALVNNLNSRFKAIQVRARRLLASERNVELDEVEWAIGCLHDLRRTYGTMMARHVSIHVLCAWLGHSSMETTQTYYLSVEERDADTGRLALDALYVGADAQRTRKPVLEENRTGAVA